MSTFTRSVIVATVVLLAAPLAWAKSDDLRSQAAALFGTLPEEAPAPDYNPTTPEKVELGKKLFFEPRLSMTQTISCNSCHNLSMTGADNVPFSIGHEGARGGRNSPTVLNAAIHTAQFWDGRAETLEEQAAGPITNPVEMAMPADDHGQFVVDTISSIPGYQKEFREVFGRRNPVSMENITHAIAAFERTLMTPGRFDRWLEGDDKALNRQEKRGLKTFIDVGCAGCHTGPALGGNAFFKMGLVEEYPNQDDLGRYEVTGEEHDKMVFKVPSLRNVATTEPYFHDSSVWTLEEAVVAMGKYQLGREFSKKELNDMVAFLKALDGDRLQMDLPLLPPSGPDTPRPAAPDPALTAGTSDDE